MKTIFHGILPFLVLTASLRAEEAPKFDPQKIDADRYRQLWEKSPFVAEAPATPQKGGIAQRFVIIGMATLDDEPLVFVLDRQSLARLVVTRKSDPATLQLVSVESNVDPKQSTATVRLGAEQAVIRYDVAALQSVNQPAETAGKSAPQNTPPSAAPTDSGTIAQPATNSLPRPTRVIRRTISLQNPK